MGLVWIDTTCVYPLLSIGVWCIFVLSVSNIFLQDELRTDCIVLTKFDVCAGRVMCLLVVLLVCWFVYSLCLFSKFSSSMRDFIILVLILKFFIFSLFGKIKSLKKSLCYKHKKLAQAYWLCVYRLFYVQIMFYMYRLYIYIHIYSHKYIILCTCRQCYTYTGYDMCRLCYKRTRFIMHIHAMLRGNIVRFFRVISYFGETCSP